MNIVSTSFLFLFLPLVIGGYFLLPQQGNLRWRNLLLLGASYGFYAWGEPLFVLLLAGLTVLTWGLGRMAEGRAGTPLGHAAVTLTVLLNVGVLLAFAKFKLAHLPLGLSFFAFHSIAYVVDIYRGRCKAAPRLLDAALYLCVFFKMLQGPIVTYWEFEPQIEGRTTTSDDFAEGMWRFAVGFAKKLVVAGNLAPLVDYVFASDYAALSLLDAWTGCVVYMLVLYVDFSGYSDMAIGLGRVFGFKLPENFNYPYLSTSIGEYWRRWHMTLIAWFRDYMYYPIVLGPSVRFRKFLLRHHVGEQLARNLQDVFVPACVWLMTALWHGANWNYLIWGLSNSGAMTVEPRLKPVGKRLGVRLLRWAGTMLLLMMFVPLIRTESLTMAVGYFKVMFGASGHYALSGPAGYWLKVCRWLLPLTMAGALGFFPWFKGKLYPTNHPRLWNLWNLGEAVLLMVATVLALGFLFKTGTQVFLYQQ